MRLRGASLTALAALTLTAALSVPADSRSFSESAQDQNQQSQQTQESQPVAPPVTVPGYQGLVVQEIHIPGVAAGDQQRFFQLVPQKSGEPLDRDLIRQSIQKLHDTGRFADIRVEAEKTPNGQVSVNFITIANYFVGDVTVTGTPNRPAANQVASASKLQLGELFTPDKLDRAQVNIKRLLEENGYYRSSTTEEEQKHPDTQEISIVFRVVPGRQAQVGRVTATGNPGYSEGQVQDIAKMHPGDFVSVQRLNRALERIRKKYQKQNRLLSQVSVAHTYRPDINWVDYTFNIQPGPKVDIAAEGFKISRGVLRRNVPVYEENALDDDLLNEGRRNLLNYLQSRGYFDAKVSINKSTESGGDELRVVYTIDAGSRHKLARIIIAGNKYFPETILRSRMDVQPAGHLFSHGRYSQGLLNADLKGIEGLYRSNGFQQVQVTSNIQDNYQGQSNQLVLNVQVQEGPQTLVGALHFVGNRAFAEDELRSRVNTSEGQPYSEFYISQDRDTVLNFYFNRGFPNATFEASAQPISGDPNHMDVTYKVQEGEQEFVRHVLVSGLNYTRPFVAQREIQVKPGDPLSQIDMLKTQQRLYDLGIFSQVDTAVQNPDGAEREKNVLVDVQEAKRYTFNYGLGLEFQTGQPAVGTNQPQGETGVSPRVSFDVTRLNFLGRNHSLTFKSHVGRLQQRGLISYDAPRIFNSPNWRLAFTTFYDNTLDVTTFTSERLEGSVEAEQILSRSGSGSPVSILDYRFTYRRVRASNLEISTNLVPLLSQPTRVGMPGFSYIRDKRDNPLETTRGNYTTVDSGVASNYFGSEADFSRVLIQNSTYYAFGKNRPAGKKFIFARSTRIGLENPLGNTVIVAPGEAVPADHSLIPLPERFFSGGGNSHRGFGLNQAGPRDPQSGFPLGGSALFLNNLELRFPPVTLPFFQDNMSFAIFHDAGNVFVDGHSMLHNLLRWQQKDSQLCLQQSTANQCDYSYISHAIGVGVRYKTPIGPVRFDFGYNLNPPAFPSLQTVPDPNNPGQEISTFLPQRVRHFNVFFSIGQTF